MNAEQRMKVYKEARTYGVIQADESIGPVRLLVIVYDLKRFNVCLVRGEVFALTVEG